ncbi:hypothetical protein BR1R3_00610 [Pseudomonas atacamensis]|uniref:hypothetical protein n=1 Tax=Pseudomonas atacamensis TaxID=2565368 RepID=UPI0022C950BF|nr:hypothetical protein [Pseudomonas atacamensis]GLH17320.1 hypothetical protein BR1R3_00610 [Pseudomonas atacamensis]
MSGFIENLSPKEWESFCEVMLRQHFGAKNFYTVPDQDGGDLGLEFYTIDGTIFQCYYPDSGIEMGIYKKRIQKKINDDLKKLKENEKEKLKLIDDIKINQWVLLTPEFKSKDLISYCNKKKKEVILEDISYIENSTFKVKIETAESYPDGKLYAQGVYNAAINIPLLTVDESLRNTWISSNAQFSSNIARKSTKLMGERSEDFQNIVVSKYIQIDKFLEQLRDDHPNLHATIEDSARAQLESIKENSIFLSKLDSDFVKSIVENNKEAFSKHSKFMSDTNVQSLTFGYLSKWIAECYMDFK